MATRLERSTAVRRFVKQQIARKLSPAPALRGLLRSFAYTLSWFSPCKSLDRGCPANSANSLKPESGHKVELAHGGGGSNSPGAGRTQVRIYPQILHGVENVVRRGAEFHAACFA